jgi:dTDP-4-amino-4,6-dideoxygalactose transaminase
VIPWASPGAQYRAHEADIQAAIQRVLASGNYILGPEVDVFEAEFAAYCGVAHAVAVGSGTDALILAMQALGIGAGDEVVTVSHTALATGAAVVAAGATPVLVDVDPDYYTVDPAAVERAISACTKAIIAVHLYGQVADVVALREIAKRRGVKLIEDCAQAAGARLGERRVGAMADVGCFSFYPTKNLGAIGDGGMITTGDAELAGRLRRLRQYGWDDARNTLEPGVNSRLDPLQAAILRCKLPHLDADNAQRAALAAHYNEGLARLPLKLPKQRPGTSHVYHLYVVTCDDRTSVQQALARAEIGAAVHYATPVHLHPGYSERARLPAAGLPVTERLANTVLTLPLFPELTHDECELVIAALRRHFGAAG